jgi:hypothetical protein
MSMETVDPSEATQAFGVHFNFPNTEQAEEIQPDSKADDEMQLVADDVTRAFRGDYEVPLHRPGVDEAAMAQIAEQQARNRSTRRSSLSFAPPSPAQNDEKTLEEEAEDLSMEMSLDGSPTVDFGALTSSNGVGRRLSERVRRGSLAPGVAGVALLDGEDEEDVGDRGSASMTRDEEEEDADRTMEMDETTAFASIYQHRQHLSSRLSLAAPPDVQQHQGAAPTIVQDLLTRSPSPSKSSLRHSQTALGSDPAPPATPSRATPKSTRKTSQHSPVKHSPGRAITLASPATTPNTVIPPSSLSRKPVPSPAFASPNKQRKGSSASPRRSVLQSPSTVKAALPAGSPLASQNSGPLPSSVVKGNPASKRLAEIVADEEDPERLHDSFGSDGGVCLDLQVIEARTPFAERQGTGWAARFTTSLARRVSRTHKCSIY